LAAALYLFNPATVLAGAVWGQLDAVGTAAVVGSLMTVASGRYVTAGMLSVLAVLVKPQFAIAGAVVLGMLALRRDGGGRAAAFALAAVGGVAAYLAVTVPLGLGPAELFAIVGDSAAQMSFASLHGFNAWGLIFGFGTTDGPWVYLGLALLAAGVLGALALLYLRRDLAGVFGVAFLIALAVYFLPTRVHERYLFPAIALLAPLVALRPTLLRPFIALSGVFSLSLLYVLIRGRRSGAIDVPLRVERLLDWPGVPLIAVALMAAALWCALGVWRVFREQEVERTAPVR
jgi:Gpi18-like mannosyltransferase